MKAHRTLLIFGMLLVAGACSSQAGTGTSSAPTAPPTTSPAVECGSRLPRSFIGRIAIPPGLTVEDAVVSRQSPDVIWIAGVDAAGRPQAHAVRLDGAMLATVELSGRLEGVTDISVGPGPGPGSEYLYAADLHPERTAGGSLAVVRVAAPMFGSDDAGGRTEVFELLVPAGFGRPSAMGVEPVTGDVVVLASTLRDVNVLRASGPAGTEPSLLDVTASLDPGATGGVDDIAIGANGDVFALSQLTGVSFWFRAPDASVAETLVQAPCDGFTQSSDEDSLFAFGPDGSGLLAINLESQEVFNYEVPEHRLTGGAASGSAGGNLAPVVEIQPPGSEAWGIGESVEVEATVSDDEAVDQSALVWELVHTTCSTEQSCESQVVAGARGNPAALVADGAGAVLTGDFELRATYTDGRGLTGAASMPFAPQMVTIGFASNRPGAVIQVGDVAAETPFAIEAIVGDSLSVTADPVQTIDDTSYEFAAWSNAATRSYELPVDGVDQTITLELVPERGYVRFTGVPGSYAERSLSLPAGTDVIDLRGWVTLDDWTPETDQAVLGAAGNRLELAVLRDGRLQGGVRLSTGELTRVTSTQPVAADAGERLWLRYVLNLTTGEAAFYTSSDAENSYSAVEWTQLGEPGAIENPGTLFSPIRFLFAGQSNQNSARSMSGKLYQVAVLADGALWARVDFSTTSQLTSSPPTYSRWGTWTLRGSDWEYFRSAAS